MRQGCSAGGNNKRNSCGAGGGLLIDYTTVCFSKRQQVGGVGVHMLVCTCWRAHGVHILVCTCWCAHAGVRMLVCTCWCVHTGVRMLVCTCWCAHTGVYTLVCLATRWQQRAVCSTAIPDQNMATLTLPVIKGADSN